jgi:GNAT superfamily N-acetyltransferase
MKPLTFHTRPVDLGRPSDQQALLDLLQMYALDPMGGGAGLAPVASQRLVTRLQATPHYRGWLAWASDEDDAPPQPVGLLNAFVGFSTFAAAPLLNVHDIAVVPHARGAGIGRALLRAAEAHALALGCCKLTLEVLEGNLAAQALYADEGYASYSLDPQTGRAMFWQKKLA